MTILFLLALCGVGGALAFAALRKRRREPADVAWRTTPGTIVASSVGRRREGEMSNFYIPQVQYSYVVDGVERKGFRLTSASVRSDRLKAAQAWCDQYPVGMAVTVHYDPVRPQDAVLQRGAAPVEGGEANAA